VGKGAGKMKTEFNLSGKVWAEAGIYTEGDVQEFIQRVKIKIVENDIFTADEIFRVIDKLAGERLSGVGK
jgi:hypothetical protein